MSRVLPSQPVVAWVCADPGIPVFGTKGASVHVQEIIRAWQARESGRASCMERV